MPDTRKHPVRDIILIGGSAGSIEALVRIVGALPVDFPATVFVVVHTSANGPGLLSGVLSRAAAIPAKTPSDGETFEPGKIYVAPPDHHLTISSGNFIQLRRGPRENGHRPAIDPLFRSAVTSGYGSRSIAVILSGYLDDGSAGLYAVRSRGGIGIVQDPSDAVAEDMPRNALRYAGTDYVFSSAEIGGKLIELVSRPTRDVTMSKTKNNRRRTRTGAAPKSRAKTEAVLANQLVAYGEEVNGTPSVFACPECHGVLFEIKEGKASRYRCRVGHAFSEATLNQQLGAAAETALWAAMRALDEKAAMTRRMADTASAAQAWSTRLREQAEAYASHADVVREMIIGKPSSEERREDNSSRHAGRRKHNRRSSG